MVIGCWTKAQLSSGDLFSFSNQFKICYFIFIHEININFFIMLFISFPHTLYTNRCRNIITDFITKLDGFNSAEL